VNGIFRPQGCRIRGRAVDLQGWELTL
jgi:hypothetical protein